MGLFKEKTIAEKLQSCKYNNDVVKVIQGIKTEADVCEFVYNCPTRFTDLGKAVINSINDDRLLLKIILSIERNSKNADLLNYIVEKIDKRYYSTIYSEALHKLPFKSACIVEEYKKKSDTSDSNDANSLLKGALNANNSDSVRRSAMVRLININDSSVLINLFQNQDKGFSDVVSNITDIDLLFEIARSAKNYRYREDALHGLVLKKDDLDAEQYGEFLSLFARNAGWGNKDVDSFADDINALKFIKENAESEAIKLNALKLWIEAAGLSPQELLNNYRLLPDDRPFDVDDIRKIILNQLSLADSSFKENVILNEHIDWKAKMSLLSSMKKSADDEIIRQRCAKYLLDNPSPDIDPNRWYYEIVLSIDKEDANDLDLTYRVSEHEAEDQYGRYDEEVYHITYKGNDYKYP